MRRLWRRLRAAWAVVLGKPVGFRLRIHGQVTVGDGAHLYDCVFTDRPAESVINAFPRAWEVSLPNTENVITVKNTEELRRAVAEAKSGDKIALCDGKYTFSYKEWPVK